LAMDSVAYGAIGLGLRFESTREALVPVGAGMYLLSAPFQHAWRYRWGSAALSLGGRVALPLGGAMLGAAASCGNTDHDCSPAVWGGLIAGMVTATVLDGALVAHEPLPPSMDGWQPIVGVGRASAFIGAQGQF
jgi:hypothetical protein